MNLKQARDKREGGKFQQEHATLDREIAEWREWWGELSQMGVPHFGEMGDRLAAFREHLAAHFAHEENQGCLSIVTKAPPEVTRRIAELRGEHGDFLRELDQLITRLHACDPDFGCWGTAREEFEEFLDCLNTHEDAEEALLGQLP